MQLTAPTTTYCGASKWHVGGVGRIGPGGRPNTANNLLAKRSLNYSSVRG